MVNIMDNIETKCRPEADRDSHSRIQEPGAS